MITLYEFAALPMDERANELWNHGTFLTATDHPKGRSAWYAHPGGFYLGSG